MERKRFWRSPQKKRPQQGLCWGAVVAVVALHVGLLAFSATRQSPTFNEPGHLVAGLSHWELGRYELYRVNPPLTRYLAALPVMAAGYHEDWSEYRDSPTTRSEFLIGADFIRGNGERSIWLFALARWACIPISVAGGLLCFAWSHELWSSRAAGFVSLVCWCFSPNLLAHGQLVTPDCAAATFGLGAGYFFWRWLKRATWQRAFMAGLFLGLAELSKTSWIILFGLWPVLWLLWIRTDDLHRHSCRLRSILQLVFLLCLGVYLLNLGYGFDESFTRLRNYTFVSKTLSGREVAGQPGNRFADSWMGEVPVPVPKQYLLGIDVQKKDLEHYSAPSYLRGGWKQGGWWYYYLYAAAVKTPHGTQLLALLALFACVRQWWSRRARSDTRTCSEQGVECVKPFPRPCDLIVLCVPAITLVVLVSSQLEFNQHFRYIAPALGFGFVFIGTAGRWLTATERGGIEPRSQTTASLHLCCRILVMASVTTVAGTTLWTYPHQLSYFNELAGGPRNGHRHLLHSNLDWGQDLLFLKAWLDSRPDAKPVYLAYHGGIDPADIGLGDVIELLPRSLPSPHSEEFYIAVSANLLFADLDTTPNGYRQTREDVLRRFVDVTPVAQGGYSILVFTSPVRSEDKER